MFIAILAVLLHLRLCSTRLDPKTFSLASQGASQPAAGKQTSWLDVLKGSQTEGIFEDALAQTFDSIDQSKTVGELHGLLKWLAKAKEQVDERVPELQVRFGCVVRSSVTHNFPNSMSRFLSLLSRITSCSK